jgi:hypothetical protein
VNDLEKKLYNALQESKSELEYLKDCHIFSPKGEKVEVERLVLTHIDNAIEYVNMKTPDEILYEVNKGLEAQFISYSWYNMIDDLQLSKAEKEWAKQHTTFRAVMVG